MVQGIDSVLAVGRNSHDAYLFVSRDGDAYVHWGAAGDGHPIDAGAKALRISRPVHYGMAIRRDDEALDQHAGSKIMGKRRAISPRRGYAEKFVHRVGARVRQEDCKTPVRADLERFDITAHRQFPAQLEIGQDRLRRARQAQAEQSHQEQRDAAKNPKRLTPCAHLALPECFLIIEYK